MKRLLIAVFVGLLATGCSSSNTQIVRRADGTCVSRQENHFLGIRTSTNEFNTICPQN